MAMDRKTVEAKIDEVLTANSKKNAAVKKEKQQQADADPFAGGMPNMGDNPFAAFGGAGGKLPLKMRIMTKLAGLAMNPKISRFLQKKWWPLWVVVGILLSGFLIIGAVLFGIWLLIRGIINAYADLFKKRS